MTIAAPAPKPAPTVRELSAADLDFATLLRPGDRLVAGQMAGEPLTLTEALTAQRHALTGIEIFVGVLNDTAFTAETVDRLRYRSFGAMGRAAALFAAGGLDVVPVSLGRIGAAIAEGRIGCDVALVQLAPTDDPARFAFAVTNDYMREAVARARLVIAEVNSAAPRTCGEDAIAIADIDVLVRTDRPLAMRSERAPGETDRRIAAHVAELIEDGATLQAGIGGVPDAVLPLLRDRRDLGYHAGLLGDGVAALMDAGVITNARKASDRGRSVTALISGSAELLRFVDGNPAVSLRSSAYTNSVGVIAGIDRFTALNSALEVDLTGAINGECVGGRRIGGIGGLPDFVVGALSARGGRSIIALPATAAGGSASRIVRRLNGPATMPAAFADVVVTEHGRAELRGQPLAERARRLIAIAAPELRETLNREAFDAGTFA